MNRMEWRFTLGATLAALVVLVLLRSPLDGVEDQVTALLYQVRGSHPADTNVVVVYIDQEAIKSLDWPVRRNFYALMLKALADLHAKAVGIEAVFEDPKLEYPEYDDLVARMIAASGNVVLTCYSDSVAARGASAAGTSLPPGLFEYPAVLAEVPYVSRLHLPLPSFRQGAAGIGHVNIEGNADIDLFLGSGRSRVAAFGLELARVFSGTERNGVVVEGTRVTFRRDAGSLSFTTTWSGRARINFPGPVGSFASYPFLEVLKAYDALRADRVPAIPVRDFRGKIVLVGVIAEGRSEFLRTPVDPHYPAVALHAAFIDNALENRFISYTPWWLTILVALAGGIICGWSVLSLRPSLNPLVLAAALFLLPVLSYALFAGTGVLFPVVTPLAACLAAGIAGLLLRQQRTKEHVDLLEAEKKNILERLHDREAKVSMLEQDIVNLGTARPQDRMEDLLEELRRYKAEVRSLSSQADDLDAFEGDAAPGTAASDEFEGMVYNTRGVMAPVMEFIAKIAVSNAPVLALGESGTGKELVARAIHRRSPRAAGTFVAVNCSALAESLLESELFGHEKGAFTGALKDKAGRFELADGGTIFLDEIGEVSEGFQLKLLRVLQEGEFERVGGTKTIRVNVRIVAATNKDLKEQVRQKKFREDLYYRLDVLSVVLPPLRERQSDIPLLIGHFLRREGGTVRVSKNVMDALQNYSWPGNIRELESAIKRGVLLAKAEGRSMVTIKDLNEDIASAARGAAPVEDQVLESLRDKGFSRSSVSDTADELGGLNRGTVAEYLRGECLKAFAESTFDLERAVRRISLSADADVNDRVRKKFNDYLSNIAEGIVPTQPWEINRSGLRPKSKNLPQKYHLFLEQVGEAFYRGLWRLSG